MRDARRVRTTLDLADDVLQAARELATARGETMGAVVSGLARKGLAAPGRAARAERRAAPPAAAGRVPAHHDEARERAARRRHLAMSRVALLDVNVLVALFDPNHVHHDLAHDWFADHHADGWATCPLTENGLVRVLANPAYGLEGMRPDAIVGGLRTFCASRHHVFWSETVSLTDQRFFSAPHVAGHRQVTDIYLLGLATRMRGCLATFDRTIPIKAVAGGTASALQVIGPAD